MAEVTALASVVSAARRDDNKVRVAKLAAAAHRQARGRRLDQLIPGYKLEHALVLPVGACSSLQRRSRFPSLRNSAQYYSQKTFK